MNYYFNKFSLLFANVYSKGFFHLFSANLITAFLGFGSQILVAKYLTPVELGQIKTLQSFAGVMIILSGFGLNGAILKLCSENRSLEEKAFFLKKSIYLTSIPIIISLLITFTIAEYNLISPDKEINKWIVIYVILIPASAYVSLIMAYLQATKRIQLMAKVQTMIKLLGVLSLIYCTYKVGMWGYIISSIAITYISLFPLLKAIRKELKSRISVRKANNQLLYYSKWNLADNLLNTIGRYADIFILNYFVLDRGSLGHYSLATIFILGLSYLTTTVQVIAIPYFSEKSENKTEFLRVYKKYQNILMFTSIVLTAISIPIVTLFVNLVFGENYSNTTYYFQIISIKNLLWSFYALPGAAILALGKFQYNTLFVISTVPLNFIMAYYFVKYYGTMGVAVSQVFSSLISLIIMSFIFKIVIKIHFK